MTASIQFSNRAESCQAAQKFYEGLDEGFVLPPGQEGRQAARQAARKVGFVGEEFEAFVWLRHRLSPSLALFLRADWSFSWLNCYLKSCRQPGLGASMVPDDASSVEDVDYSILDEAVRVFYRHLGDEFCLPANPRDWKLVEYVAARFEIETESFGRLVFGEHVLFRDWLASRLEPNTKYGWLNRKILRSRRSDDLRRIDSISDKQLAELAGRFFDALEDTFDEYDRFESPLDKEMKAVEIADRMARGENIDNRSDRLFRIFYGDDRRRSVDVLARLEPEYRFEWVNEEIRSCLNAKRDENGT